MVSLSDEVEQILFTETGKNRRGIGTDLSSAGVGDTDIDQVF